MVRSGRNSNSFEMLCMSSLPASIKRFRLKVVHKHVSNFFRDDNAITTLQSGFVPGDSTVNQLIDIYNTLCKVLYGISKAFDRVWHMGLLFKLRSAGVTGFLLSWYSDYLNDRKQRVVLPGASSSWTSVKAGVPKGSILGPLLFRLHIDDIVDDKTLRWWYPFVHYCW